MVFGKFFGSSKEEVPSENPKQPEGQAEKPQAIVEKVTEPTLSLEKMYESESVLYDTEQIISVDGYSVVLKNEEIVVIDEYGKVVEDFSSKNSRSIQFRWSDLNHENRPWDHVKISDLSIPPSLTNAYQSARSSFQGYDSASRLRAYPYKPEGKIKLTKSGDHLYISSDGHVFLAYQIRKDGQTLPPRMWVRIESVSTTKIPNEMKDEMRDLRSFKERKHVRLATIEDGVAFADEHGVEFSQKNTGKAFKLFKDPVIGVEDNLCTDPTGNIVSYCRSQNPVELIQIDTRTDPSTWHTTKPLRFPTELRIGEIAHLEMDHSGRFYTCTIDETFTILEADTLKPVEIGKAKELTNQTLDPDGNIRGINDEKKLVVYKTNLDALGQAIEARKVAQLAAGISVGNLFTKTGGKPTAQKGPQASAEDMAAFTAIKTQYENAFGAQIDQAETEDDVHELETALETLKQQLGTQSLKPAQIAFITEGIAAGIKEKMQAIADAKVNDIMKSVRTKMVGGVTLRMISDVSNDIADARALENSISPATRDEVLKLSAEFQQRSQDLFRSAGAEIKREADGFVDHARGELAKMDRHTQFDQWRDFELPRLKRLLTETARNCPSECTEALEHITQARLRLQELADTQEARFRDQFEQVRERAANQTQLMVDTLKGEITGLIDRMRARQFTSREQADTFIKTSPAFSELSEEIQLLAEKNSDASAELTRTLEVAIANFLYEVERKGTTVIAGDGRQMEMFGSTAFPVFEAPVAKKQQKDVSVTFDVEEKSKGPGVRAEQLMGDIGLRIKTSTGHEKNMRLWEGRQDEDDLRYGMVNMYGQPVQASYLSQAEYVKLRKQYGEWQKKGGIKDQLTQLRDEVHAHYKKRIQPPKARVKHEAEDVVWKKEHQELLTKLSEFYGKHPVALMQRIERIEQADEPDFENGKGLVPEWKNHWVTAPEDEKMLEQMAQYFEMQLKLQEGMLNLKGHAGTGKDVLMKMFANRTRRPYFAFDCSKWTTESDLSEDIVLESVNGASQTVYIPSAVVQAIQTPGAILYFNEWNAMPESAQVFMHSLLDEKRSMTLKTRSGETIKAHPTVLIASSMNPNYPGTFAPQMATRSRIVDIEVDYPPLLRDADPGDTNPNKPYSVSEALKIAGSVPSLERATIDRNMKHNDFVKWWDYEINGIGSAPNITASQKFDIEAVNALVQFSAQLRDAFKAQYSGKAGRRTNTLPVTAPITLREMRRCGYMLGEMTDEEKVSADPEKVAKDLIRSFFLSHIDNEEDREKIATAMGTWTAKKRLT